MGEDTQHSVGEHDVGEHDVTSTGGDAQAGGVTPSGGASADGTRADGAPEDSPSDPTTRRAAEATVYSVAESQAERRRLIIRRIANWMIILSVLSLIGIVIYFVATWLYAAHEQDVLRDELAAENPGLAAAQNVSESDFISIDGLRQELADVVAAREAEAERLEQLAALKEVADEYQRAILGRVGKAIGQIVIPSIGVETIMVEGNFEQFSERYLKMGPGHWPETPLPGQGGSVVVSGHRTTYGAPFRKLNDLVPGDVIEITMPYAIVRYEVTQVIVVQPEDVEVVSDQGKEMLSLVACHPLYSAKQRIIAQGDMSSFVLLESEQ